MEHYWLEEVEENEFESCICMKDEWESQRYLDPKPTEMLYHLLKGKFQAANSF